MRSVKLLMVGAIAAVALACNNQPRIYRVAIDSTNLNALPVTCWVDNKPPDTAERLQINNIRQELEWAIWDGVEGKQYLDMGPNTSFGLGHAEPVAISDLIEGQDNTFTGTETRTRLPDPNDFPANRSYVRTKSVTVTFADQSASPTGTIQVNSAYTCTNCRDRELETVGNKTCATSLSFVARRIDAQQITGYGNNSGQ